MGTSAIKASESASAPTRLRSAARRAIVDGACRFLDVILSSILLAVLSPLMIAVAAAIVLDSPGPVIFRQRRVGLGQAFFTVHKFRTMHNGVSHDVHREFVRLLIGGAQPLGRRGEPRFKLSDDGRVTRVGRFLRRSSLDELPQLWDVLRGRMSLVGPRPALSYEVDHYQADWFRRFNVKPGMTGLWQVSGRSELTIEDMIRLDIEYANRRSFWLNVWILVRTVPAVLSVRGAS